MKMETIGQSNKSQKHKWLAQARCSYIPWMVRKT